MSRVKYGDSGRELTKVIFIRFFITLLLFTVILGIVYVTAALIIPWLADDLPYINTILHLMSDYRVPILLICWIIGFFLIFLIFWKNTLRYIDTIVEASNELVEANDNRIHLPVELKQVEDQMNQVKQAAIRNARLAKEAEQRKNDLLVYLAHDLKTPLTSVIGYLTLLRDEKEISEKLREKYLSISLDKAERLEDLINEFFEITRFNLSQLSLDQTRVNVTRMLEQIAYEFKPIMATKHLQYALEMEPDIEIICDVHKMERVFDNLIRNAINYSFENETIKIVAVKKDNGVEIHFENRGNTISKEKQSRIFEQFYRLDVSRGTKTGGAGLGLAIAKEIVERHQGRITVFSENETIRFTVFLPGTL